LKSKVISSFIEKKFLIFKLVINAIIKIPIYFLPKL
jgi:hypothetical protein